MKDEQKKNEIFFFEDYSARNLTESKVGRKGLSLFHLKDMDVPVPDFFIISGDVFVDVCYPALEESIPKLLSKGRNPETEEVEAVLEKARFSQEQDNEILNAYTRLSGFTDAWVSVRSSVVFPENEEVSFSGVFSTELNVRGFNDLKQAIKRIFASMFCDDVVAYASKMRIDLSDVKLAVVVQKMVQAEVSGVIFTTDPITQDDTKLSIEAVFGLGDVISLGEITPDLYLLNKKDLSIVEKHIAPQEWMKVRTMQSSSKRQNNVERIKISNNWSHRQKLSNKDMSEIAKIALIVENKSRQAQDLEWVLSGGRFWILQNKNLYEPLVQERIMPVSITTTVPTLRELIKAFVGKYKGQKKIVSQAMSEAQRMMQKSVVDEEAKRLESLILSAKKESDKEEREVEQDDFIVSGIGASFGSVVGKINIVDSPVDKKFNKQDILLIKRYSTEMESMIIASGGVIMDTGGVTSDTAILCREFGIPAVVGANGASQLLKSGDWVRIDGNAGTIYKAKKEEIKEDIHPVVKAYSTEELSGVSKAEEKEKEQKEELPPKDISLPPTATKVFSLANLKPEKLFDYVGDAHGIVTIDLDKILIEDGRHPMAYVEEKKFVDYSKKISEKILGYVNLARGEEVIISIGSKKVKDFRGLIKGTQFENSSLGDDIHGAMHYINNLDTLKRVIKIVKRIRNVHNKRNVSVALHSPMTGDAMKEFKKQLSGERLRRSSSFKVYALLENAAEIIVTDEILSTKIDGLILNMPAIARQMQGFAFDDEKARYDLSRNSVFKVLDSVLEKVKSKTENIVVMIEDSKPLLRYCVQAGVYGVSVFPENIAESRKVISEEETKLILGK